MTQTLGFSPDIEAEGERLVSETPKRPDGSYLWTDVVGAVQSGISDERERNAARLEPAKKRLRDDIDSNVGTYAAQILGLLP